MCYQWCYWIYINMSCSHVINSLLFYIEPDMRKLYHPRLNKHTHTLQSKLTARDDIEKCSHINPIFFFPPSFMVAVISAIILFITSSHFRGKFFIAHNCRDTRWKTVRRTFTHWIFITCVILVTRYICSDVRDCPNLCQLALENCLWSWPSI